MCVRYKREDGWVFGRHNKGSTQTKVIPRAAAENTKKEFMDNIEPALVEFPPVGAGALLVPFPEAMGALGARPAPPVIGPGGADAEAPTPTRFPCPCCMGGAMVEYLCDK
jgi:hypothetical protein